MKLRALPYAGIGMRFYDILRQETPLWPNTEPQGVPEALNGTVRYHQFSIVWDTRDKECFS